MNVEHRPADRTATPPARHPTWPARTTLAAVGIAVAIATGGGLAVYAATAGSSTTGPGLAGPPLGWEGPPGPRPEAEIAARALHSRSVTADGKGGFTTELTQTGAVIATTGSTVTVRSDDGYTQTYILGADTRAPRQPVQTGQHVSVRASVANDTATAAVIAAVG